MITIRATDAGFFNLSPLSQQLAPNALLKTRVNSEGTLVGSADARVWESAESFRYSDFGITAEGTLDPDAQSQIGHLADFAFEGLSYYRIEDGDKIEIGTLEISQPVSLTARFDTFGAEDDLLWQVDVGDMLADLVASRGLRFFGGAGDDVYAPHVSSYPVYANVKLFGFGGSDTLTGSFGDDLIKGGWGHDTLSDAYGVNTLKGGKGNDTISVTSALGGSLGHGGAGNDWVTSGLGGDVLSGNSGHDWLVGNSGGDTLIGGGGHDTLDGGSGEDLIDGGRGWDQLAGGEDADVFLFRDGEKGYDTILDFEIGVDIVRLIGFTGGYADLDLRQNDADVVLERPTGHSITFEDTLLSELTEDHFIFIFV